MARHLKRRARGPMERPQTKKVRSTGGSAGLVEKTLRTLELPVETVIGLPHLELSGNREAVIDGCKGILQYDENVVKIKTGKMMLRFTGTGLNLRSLTDSSLVIEGFISGIEFLF